MKVSPDSVPNKNKDDDNEHEPPNWLAYIVVGILIAATIICVILFL